MSDIGKRIYQFDEDEFISNYNKLKSSRKMADLYGCDKGTILNYAKSINYVNQMHTLTDHERQEIVNQYYIKNSKELAQEYGVSKSLIIKIWMDANITDKKKKRIYNFNERYFEKIDTPDKAYFLGLLAADGNICRPYDNRQAIIRISLIEEDKDILEKFNLYVKSKKPLHCNIRHHENSKNVYTLELVSNLMADDLAQYNIIPNKTKYFVTPLNIPMSLMSHYIRGYFDGDGSIVKKQSSNDLPSLYTCTITGFKKNLKVIQWFLAFENIKTYFQRDYRTGTDENEFGDIRITSNNNKQRFLKYIYSNCSDLYIQRKKNLADNFLKSYLQ